MGALWAPWGPMGPMGPMGPHGPPGGGGDGGGAIPAGLPPPANVPRDEISREGPSPHSDVGIVSRS